MGFFGSRKEPGVPDLSEKVEMVDTYGRRITMSKKEWRDKVMLPALQKSLNDSPELEHQIFQAFQDGFYKDVLPFAQRLLEITQGSENSTAILAVAYLQCEKLEEAEQVLNQCIQKSGPSGILLTNLAKVYSFRGDETKARETLWKALELDPNQENGLDWWLSLQRQEGGEAAYRNSLEKLASFPGTWRPQLWLGVDALDQKNLEQALGYFQHCIQTALDMPDVLIVVSGELGRHGYLDKMVELVLPLYDPRKHAIQAGTNLLKACLQIKKIAEGKALLEKMFALDRPDLKEVLKNYANEFEKLAGL